MNLTRYLPELVLTLACSAAATYGIAAFSLYRGRENTVTALSRDFQTLSQISNPAPPKSFDAFPSNNSRSPQPASASTSLAKRSDTPIPPILDLWTDANYGKLQTVAAKSRVAVEYINYFLMIQMPSEKKKHLLELLCTKQSLETYRVQYESLMHERPSDFNKSLAEVTDAIGSILTPAEQANLDEYQHSLQSRGRISSLSTHLKDAGIPLSAAQEQYLVGVQQQYGRLSPEPGILPEEALMALAKDNVITNEQLSAVVEAQRLRLSLLNLKSFLIPNPR